MISSFIKKCILSSSFFFLHLLMRFIKLTLAYGSFHFFFPVSICFLPLMGIWGGFEAAGIFLLIHIIGQNVITSGLSSLLLAYHIPTFCGTFYWALLHKNVPKVWKTTLIAIFASSAIVLFTVHPIGNQAAPYALFWLIPLFTSLFTKNAVFIHALGSTFMCHAAGSILWIYGKTALTPQGWLNLIPLVCIERLLIALIMTAFYYGIIFCINFIAAYHKNSITALTLAVKE
ncbi:MAG: hypothetical protein WA432_03610 [Candidatus Babeliaceae bacterium]